MSKADEYEKRVFDILTPITDELNLKIVDVEFLKEAGNYYLRVYLDKEAGVTIEDCEAASRRLSDKMDENDFIPEAYILEVSSPGLDRPLRRERDFAYSIGREVDIKTFKEIEGRKEFRGILKEYDKETVTVEIEADNMVFERKGLASIRWAYDFEL